MRINRLAGRGDAEVWAKLAAGAAMWAPLKVAREMGGGRRVFVVLPDRGERYFSTGLFLPELL